MRQRKRAIELARQLSPEMAILDIMMPGLDGIETARALYSLHIPVVMVTAYSQPKYIKRAEKSMSAAIWSNRYRNKI